MLAPEAQVGREHLGRRSSPLSPCALGHASGDKRASYALRPYAVPQVLVDPILRATTPFSIGYVLFRHPLHCAHIRGRHECARTPLRGAAQILSLGLFNSLKTIYWFFTRSLCMIQITSNLRIPLSDAPSIVDVIAPILQLQQLRYIDILFTRQAFYFTKGEMLAIAKAFPQLEAIDLNFNAVRPMRTWNEPIRTPPTIIGFCTFAALCPNLKHASLPVLEVCISRADIPNKMEHPLSNVEFRNLRVMELYYAPSPCSPQITSPWACRLAGGATIPGGASLQANDSDILIDLSKAIAQMTLL
ncbi:hypothetical protein NUW54_g3853 [Trametes sanguinea]|uniref:Uncharacterized protein n=1 Tax=Trametes sanguinea TaxID=158606 RepID=A0ACC1Q2D9_9APHY|nr:hypothetical protein NUW54_g3853 [Trametes sanguinea]